MDPQPSTPFRSAFSRRAAVYIGLLFLSGVLLGAVVTNVVEQDWLHHMERPEVDIRQHQIIAQHLAKKLKLSSQQETKVDQVLQGVVRNYATLETQLAPRYDQVREQGREQLRAIFNPQQRAEFDVMVKHFDARYRLNGPPGVMLQTYPCSPLQVEAASQQSGP